MLINQTNAFNLIIKFNEFFEKDLLHLNEFYVFILFYFKTMSDIYIRTELNKIGVQIIIN
jgi:hypothetical protein